MRSDTPRTRDTTTSRTARGTSARPPSSSCCDGPRRTASTSRCRAGALYSLRIAATPVPWSAKIQALGGLRVAASKRFRRLRHERARPRIERPARSDRDRPADVRNRSRPFRSHTDCGACRCHGQRCVVTSAASARVRRSGQAVSGGSCEGLSPRGRCCRGRARSDEPMWPIAMGHCASGRQHTGNWAGLSH